ncbi:MAG: CBS domain-containing protein, partial [Nocardioidaceae bacterium]|nr:CBS domain-containing protein [Nocardioidaceae bacterium]
RQPAALRAARRALRLAHLKRSVLTEKIARRGYHLSREYDVDPLEIMFVSEVMTSEVVEFDPAVPMTQAHEALQDPTNDFAAWRQQLYPVVDAGQMIGVITRGDLLAASHHGENTVGEVMHADPVVTHSDQTLRRVAEDMAGSDVTTLPVTDREHPDRVVGIVSLPQLLHARRHDQQEARERERVLSVRLVRPTRR